MRYQRFLPLVLFLAIAVLLSRNVFWEPPEVSGILPASSFTEQISQGSKFKGRTYLLNVFASWCTPCLAEHPVLLEAKEKHGISIYGIAWKDRPEAIKFFLKKNNSPYAEYKVDDGIMGVDLGITGVPETYVVNSKGKIIFHHPGPLTQETFREEILPFFNR